MCTIGTTLEHFHWCTCTLVLMAPPQLEYYCTSTHCNGLYNTLHRILVPPYFGSWSFTNSWYTYLLPNLFSPVHIHTSVQYLSIHDIDIADNEALYSWYTDLFVAKVICVYVFQCECFVLNILIYIFFFNIILCFPVFRYTWLERYPYDNLLQLIHDVCLCVWKRPVGEEHDRPFKAIWGEHYVGKENTFAYALSGEKYAPS